MLRRYRADLHIHTCLSPCGNLDMSPKDIVAAAMETDLDIIAICDHNSAENVAAACRASKRAGGAVRVLPGMEVCTEEEVHVLALFDRVEAVLKLQDLVYRHMAPGHNRPDIFGEQVVVNEDDEVEGFNPRLLINAARLDLRAMTEAVHDLKGLAVAAHVDREAYGLLGQLGFVPEDLPLDALEVSRICDTDYLSGAFPGLLLWPILRNSDAHVIEDVGSAWTEFILEEPTVFEIGLALKGARGRRIRALG